MSNTPICTTTVLLLYYMFANSAFFYSGDFAAVWNRGSFAPPAAQISLGRDSVAFLSSSSSIDKVPNIPDGGTF